MKNSALMRAPMFVCALMLILLVSSMIETTVWAIKPDKPGKPSDPEPEIANYNIWIGIGEGIQHITLVSPESLLVENVSGGYWFLPPTKGTAQKESFWGINFIGETGDENGTYTVADVYGDPPNQTVLLSAELASHGINVNTESQFFMIKHTHTHLPSGRGVEDYWQIGIGWQVGYLPDSDIPHIHGIIGRTNIDAECEGEYDQTNDGTWTVAFNNAEFWLIENVEGSGDMSLLWAGKLSFTVTIVRTLLES